MVDSIIQPSLLIQFSPWLSAKYWFRTANKAFLIQAKIQKGQITRILKEELQVDGGLTNRQTVLKLRFRNKWLLYLVFCRTETP